MGIFEYALRNDKRCPSWYESEIAPVQCREKEGHDGPHEFTANSLYAVWTDEEAVSDVLMDEPKALEEDEWSDENMRRWEEADKLDPVLADWLEAQREE